MRVVVGLGLGFFLFRQGLDVAAAGATFGAGAGALVGILIIVIIYALDARRREVRLLRTSGQEESQRSILKKIGLDCDTDYYWRGDYADYVHH